MSIYNTRFFCEVWFRKLYFWSRVVEVFKVDPKVSPETNKANLLAPPRFFFFYLLKQIKKEKSWSPASCAFN